MAKCSHCRQRKAKRHCPALGSELCPLCCGQLREKTLHCPANCPFLARHKPYQEKKIIQKKRTFSRDVFDDERLNWLTLHIEAPLQALAEKDSVLTDRDAVLALEYARDRVEEERPRLLVPQGERRPQNELGEAIFQSLEQCRYQRAIILLQEVEAYKKEEKLKCLENVILALKAMAKGHLDGRAYLADLSRRFGKLQKLSEQKKVVSST